MKPRVIDWDGTRIPEELKKLPPCRYAIESIDQPSPLSEAEEKAILAGLDELGRGIPLTDVVREIRGGHQARRPIER